MPRSKSEFRGERRKYDLDTPFGSPLRTHALAALEALGGNANKMVFLLSVPGHNRGTVRKLLQGVREPATSIRIAESLRRLDHGSGNAL